MSATFEAVFLAKAAELLNDSDVTLAWARLPQGAPVLGKTDVVFFYAPGGDRELTHSNISAEQGRRIQVSIFSQDPQDVRNVAKALHDKLEGTPTAQGFSGGLSDGSYVYAIVPGIQDIDSFDNDEKVYQTVFDFLVRMTEQA